MSVAPLGRARRWFGASIAGLALCACGDQRPRAEPLDVQTRLLADQRIEAIFARCVEDGYYEENTSDPTALLIPKLTEGSGLPLNRAIEWLGELGERSVDELAALLAEQRNDPERSGSIQNTIAALGLNPSPRAKQALMSVLGHPQSLVRVAALRALGNHELEPRDYEACLNSIMIGVGQEQSLAVERLLAADPERAQLAFVEWLRDGRFGQIEELALGAIVRTEYESVWQAALEARTELYPRSQLWLDAELAARGDTEAARAFQRALLDERREFRASAVQAAIATESWSALVGVARNDPDPGLRSTALAALSNELESDDPELAADAYSVLRRALDAREGQLAEQARLALLAIGDGEAIERTLQMLDGDAAVLSQVLPSLRPLLPENDYLAERVEARLLDRIAAERDLPWGRRLPALQALGLVPRRSAAERLLEVAREVDQLGIELAGRRGHEWVCVHASNTGLPGREVLRAAFEDEVDPVRRLDLLWAATVERDDFSREVLLGAIDAERLHGLERAFAAARLANTGPVELVAPRLERLALRLEGQARVALQCVLHTWF